MFGIGMPELAVILVVALIVLGPRRLPEMARALGKGLAEFRKVTGDVNKELQGARDLIEREAREHERVQREVEREARLTKPKDTAPASSEAGTSTPPTADDAPTTTPPASDVTPKTAAAPKAAQSPADSKPTPPTEATSPAPSGSGGSQSES